MKIRVNDEEVDIKADTISSLVSELGYDNKTIAIAKNEEFVPKGDYSSTKILDGDRFDIVAPMQGG